MLKNKPIESTAVAASSMVNIPYCLFALALHFNKKVSFDNFRSAQQHRIEKKKRKQKKKSIVTLSQ